METLKLIEEFSDCVVMEPSLRICDRLQRNKSTILTVIGEDGFVDIVFREDGEIYAEFENADTYHQWSIFPNSTDIKASVKKIGNIVGRD